MKAVLFDLDGTLVDHFGVIHRSIVYAQYQLGLPKSSLSAVKRVVGGSLPVTLEKLVGEELVSEALRYYRECYDKIWHHDVVVLPGVRWLLPHLKAKDIKMAVFTNKVGSDARHVLDHLHLSPFFTKVVGTEDTEWRKPDEAFTQYILDQMKLDPELEEVVAVGDSPWDVEAAATHDLPCYCVTTGSHPRDALLVAKPAGVYKDLFELGEQVFGLERPNVRGGPKKIAS